MQTNPLAAYAGRVKTELAGRQLPRCDDGAGASFDQLLRDKAAAVDAAPGADASAWAGGGVEPGPGPGSGFGSMPRPAGSAPAEASIVATPPAAGARPISALPGDADSPMVAMSLAGPARGLLSDAGAATPESTSNAAAMPTVLAAGAKAGWPRAAKPPSQDEAFSADSAMAALADAGPRALRAVPADTALPPGAAAAPPDPSATVARCQAMLRYGVAPAGLQQPGAAWEVMLNDASGIPMSLRAQRSDGGAMGMLSTAPQPAWTLTISTPALNTSAASASAISGLALGNPVVDAAMLQRHLPRLLERLKTHALAPGHVRIEADDDGR